MSLHWDEFDDSGVKCPYCGYLDQEDYPTKKGAWTCAECGRECDVEVEHSVTYYTTKLETELDYQRKHLEYWKDEPLKHHPHADEIRKVYEAAVQKLEKRLEKAAANTTLVAKEEESE